MLNTQAVKNRSLKGQGFTCKPLAMTVDYVSYSLCASFTYVCLPLCTYKDYCQECVDLLPILIYHCM